MSKTLVIILIVLAMGLLVYNATIVDYKNPLQGDSTIALIGILASLCAIVLLLIYWASKQIAEKVKRGQ